MPLGTLDRTPPPFFRQGPSALTKLVFFAALAIFLMVADLRFKFVGPLRSTLAVALLPAQRALAVPVEIALGGSAYLGGLHQALVAERAAEQRMIAVSARAQRTDELERENARLRALLTLKPALAVRSQPAEILYEAADLYSRKVVIDRGTAQGIVLGSPVVTEQGVLGQVTHVYALTSEVTVLADKDAAIPVINVRTQQRGAAYGGLGQGRMELRFVAANADVKVGDALQTGGLDGVYPPGLAVAHVTGVDRRAESGFAHIVLRPDADPDGVRQVLVLQPLSLQMPPLPVEAAEPKPKRVIDAPGQKGASAP
ncbi:MAG: rod shape-determining protein MreC [Burkholderiales bacterium]|nr:rod shape-determining protein MreC [Burkholderiales bacterium]MDE1928658.1 rod shape-determining protein MreC [Burkholderiales bacterium]MDE2160056.1 rod shape-determining protein MreC [Burkholderiales bacterium]MDE2504071.1 rod shape-determining protein MreC [Burkholderiales bacterium]